MIPNSEATLDVRKPFESVFEMGHWTIYRHDVGVAVKHACQNHMGKRAMKIHAVFVYPSSATKCWRCTETIPEPIVALSVLYNWNFTL